MMSKRNSFLVGKAFRAYLMATVLTVAATQIASLVDATLVGQLISAEALGAVNISKPVLQLTFSIGNLFIIGGSILTGMAIGTGDREQANRLFTKCLIAVVVAGLLILSCGLIWFDEILGMLCNSDYLREMASQYLQVTFITMLPFLLSYMLETYVIVDGSPKLATIAVVISNIANVVLDITFISVFHWGVRGAATATRAGGIPLCASQSIHVDVDSGSHTVGTASAIDHNRDFVGRVGGEAGKHQLTVGGVNHGGDACHIAGVTVAHVVACGCGAQRGVIFPSNESRTCGGGHR